MSEVSISECRQEDRLLYEYYTDDDDDNITNASVALQSIKMVSPSESEDGDGKKPAAVPSHISQQKASIRPTNRHETSATAALPPLALSPNDLPQAAPTSLSLSPLSHSVATMKISTFPRKVYDIVQYISANNSHIYCKILSWHPLSSPMPGVATPEHDSMFVIWDKEEFMTQLAPRFFPNSSSFRSLERTLNAWQFVRESHEESSMFLRQVKSVPLTNIRVYYNPLFQRHDSSHLKQIQRRKGGRKALPTGSRSSPPRGQLVPLLPKPITTTVVRPTAETSAVCSKASLIFGTRAKRTPKPSPQQTPTPATAPGAFAPPRFILAPNVPVYDFASECLLPPPSKATRRGNTSSKAPVAKARLRLPLQRSERKKKRSTELESLPFQPATKRSRITPLAKILVPGMRGAGTKQPEELGSLLQQSHVEPPALTRNDSQFADAVGPNDESDDVEEEGDREDFF